MTDITLLPKQQAAVDFFLASPRSMLLEAMPGAGKSFMIEQLVQRSNETPIECLEPGRYPRTLVLAFNVSSKDTLLERLKEYDWVEVRTFNSFGFKQLRKVTGDWKVDGAKYWKIAKAWALTHWQDQEYAWEQLGAISRVVSFIRDTATDHLDAAAIASMVHEYELEDSYDPDLTAAYGAIIYAGDVLARGWRDQYELIQAAPAHIRPHLTLIDEGFTRPVGKYDRPVSIKGAQERWIDFSDQVNLPIAWGLPIDQYDLVFEDEGQDQNTSRLSLLFAALRPGGKLVAVGDSCQAINGWCGADSMSLQKTIANTNATTLGLNQSFRCPQKHTEYVRSLVGYDIESVPWNKEGSIERLTKRQLTAEIATYYAKGRELLVLSRTNAELLEYAIALLKEGIPVTVRGHDYGKGIASVIKKVCLGKYNAVKRGFTWEDFPMHLRTWYLKEQDKLLRNDASDAALQRLEDKYESIVALEQGADVDGPHEFLQVVEDLFDDERVALIVFSSVHRAKGQECGTVAILNPEKMPLYFGADEPTPEQVRQETNVIFVAYTRSKDRLLLVGE